MLSKRQSTLRYKQYGEKRSSETLAYQIPDESNLRHSPVLKAPSRTIAHENSVARVDALINRPAIGFDQKIVSMYASGMSERAIHDALSLMYGTEIPARHIDKVMDDVMVEITDWQNRPLEIMYPVMFFDVLRVAVCAEATVHHRSVCFAFGVRPDGTRDALGIWIAGTECAALWPNVFSNLRARGVNDILIAVVDGLQGASEAQELSDVIGTVFPLTTVHTDILYLIRHSQDSASHADREAVSNALRAIYAAASLKTAQKSLDEFMNGVWGKQYPAIANAWQQAWGNLKPFLTLPLEVRRIIYSAAIIENLRGRIRAVIKARGYVGDDNTVRKLLWLTLRSRTTRRVRSMSEWSVVTNRLAAFYGDRFTSQA